MQKAPKPGKVSPILSTMVIGTVSGSVTTFNPSVSNWEDIAERKIVLNTRNVNALRITTNWNSVCVTGFSQRVNTLNIGITNTKNKRRTRDGMYCMIKEAKAGGQ